MVVNEQAWGRLFIVKSKGPCFFFFVAHLTASIAWGHLPQPSTNHDWSEGTSTAFPIMMFPPSEPVDGRNPKQPPGMYKTL